ncbi:MAG: transposase [Xanthomonadales bacterium]|nr:transposase [Xanthomonadales bacterium]
MSKRHASRLYRGIDERVYAFLNRPTAGAWPYLRIDAAYVKPRQAGRSFRVAVHISVTPTPTGAHGAWHKHRRSEAETVVSNVGSPQDETRGQARSSAKLPQALCSFPANFDVARSFDCHRTRHRTCHRPIPDPGNNNASDRKSLALLTFRWRARRDSNSPQVRSYLWAAYLVLQEM